jgi:hypothetical protein
VYLSNSILNQVLARFNGQRREVDHLHRHQKPRRRYGWFLNNVLDAFDEAKGYVQRALKPANKRQ